jgi:hypothetical protein
MKIELKWKIWIFTFLLFWSILFYNEIDQTWLTSKVIVWYSSDEIKRDVNKSFIWMQDAIASSNNKEKTRNTILKWLSLVINTSDSKNVNYFITKNLFEKITNLEIK